ncbi:MAG: PEP-utilizing enzyme [Bacteriovoracaceae bacterium]
MAFDGARFKKLLSDLGLSTSVSSSRIVRLFQGPVTVVAFGDDYLQIHGNNIEEAFLRSGTPKITFQELESIMGLSERMKTAGLPDLEVEISLDRNKVSGALAREKSQVPLSGKGDLLVGLPASPGKVAGECVLSPQNMAGKILVLKNSKDLVLYLRERPAGVILEEGNLLSHASILAREAKVPALVKVKDATSILKNGDRIELDATSGTIKKI